MSDQKKCPSTYSKKWQKSRPIGDKRTNRPWEDSNGELKSDDELKEISQNWDNQTWESYLNTIESHQNELLFEEPGGIENVSSEDCAETIFECLREFDRDPYLVKSIRLHLRKLGKRERQVLELYFWESMNITQIARKLGITRATVRVHKERALSKIKSIVTSGKIGSGRKLFKMLQMNEAG